MAYKIIDEQINIKLYDKTNGKDFAYTRWIELSYKEIEIVGLHASLPVSIEDRIRIRQKAFWKRILKYADARKESKNTLLIGDFNVYEKTAFSNKPSKAYEDFKWLQDEGWKVLKTKRINDFSYCYSGCWDRQLDYAFVSPKFKYEYTLAMYRFEKLSDHEMLVVQLDI
ncbi:endonuclease/exonuclease/phosphatase family protein [Bacillus sp. RO3]|nr:endonuclease/exonuclease/phosphatase family protein [Bacillus sp. RO3]